MGWIIFFIQKVEYLVWEAIVEGRFLLVLQMEINS